MNYVYLFYKTPWKGLSSQNFLIGRWSMGRYERKITMFSLRGVKRVKFNLSKFYILFKITLFFIFICMSSCSLSLSLSLCSVLGFYLQLKTRSIYIFMRVPFSHKIKRAQCNDFILNHFP